MKNTQINLLIKLKLKKQEWKQFSPGPFPVDGGISLVWVMYQFKELLLVT